MQVLAIMGQYSTFKRAFRRIAIVRALGGRQCRNTRLKSFIGKLPAVIHDAFQSRYDRTPTQNRSIRKILPTVQVRLLCQVPPSNEDTRRIRDSASY
jgi:hypothetical protein